MDKVIDPTVVSILRAAIIADSSYNSGLPDNQTSPGVSRCKYRARRGLGDAMMVGFDYMELNLLRL